MNEYVRITITQPPDLTESFSVYDNQQLGFSITLPTTLYTYNEGWNTTSTDQAFWSIDWGSSKKEALKSVSTETGADQSIRFDDLGHYSFCISIDKNATLHPVYGTPKPLTIKKCKKHIHW